MNRQSHLVFKACVDRYTPQKKKRLFRFFSKEEAKTLETLSASLQNPFDWKAKTQNPLLSLIEKVHFSWFVAFFRSLSSQDLPIFLSALPFEHFREIKKEILSDSAPLLLNPLIRAYIQNILWQQIVKTDFVLTPYLPKSPLNALLELSFNQLKILVQLLSMHDLAIEMTQMIHAPQLQKIETFLNTHQKDYLKTLSTQKEPLVFPKMGLSFWDGTKEELQYLLFKRGLNRLSKALWKEDAGLIWAITRALDLKWYPLFNRFHSELQPAHALKILKNQVIAIISAFSNELEKIA
jgi:hypothetical protein